MSCTRILKRDSLVPRQRRLRPSSRERTPGKRKHPANGSSRSLLDESGRDSVVAINKLLSFCHSRVLGRVSSSEFRYAFVSWSNNSLFHFNFPLPREAHRSSFAGCSLESSCFLFSKETLWATDADAKAPFTPKLSANRRKVSFHSFSEYRDSFRTFC